jgi:hypothetical protein
MANRLTTFGNDLYTGKRSFNFVGGRKKWYAIAGVLIILTVLIPVFAASTSASSSAADRSSRSPASRTPRPSPRSMPWRRSCPRPTRT